MGMGWVARFVGPAALAAAMAGPPALAQIRSVGDVTGTGVRVRDGDSFYLADRLGRVFEIRLHGIDAPEIDQTCIVNRRETACGEEAADRLRELVLDREVTCLGRAVTFGRLAAQCFVGGADIAAALVRDGQAIAYRSFSQDYVDAEEEARQRRRGIWRGSMESPACFRRPRAAGCPCPIQRCVQ